MPPAASVPTPACWRAGRQGRAPPPACAHVPHRAPLAPPPPALRCMAGGGHAAGASDAAWAGTALLAGSSWELCAFPHAITSDAMRRGGRAAGTPLKRVQGLTESMPREPQTRATAAAASRTAPAWAPGCGRGGAGAAGAGAERQLGRRRRMAGWLTEGPGVVGQQAGWAQQRRCDALLLHPSNPSACQWSKLSSSSPRASQHASRHPGPSLSTGPPPRGTCAPRRATARAAHQRRWQTAPAHSLVCNAA